MYLIILATIFLLAVYVLCYYNYKSNRKYHQKLMQELHLEHTASIDVVKRLVNDLELTYSRTPDKIQNKYNK